MAKKLIYCLLALWILALSIYCVRLSCKPEDGGANSAIYRLSYIDYMKMLKNDNARLLDSIDIRNGNNEQVAIDSILKSSVLIIRYSNLDCNACVDTIVAHAKSLSLQVGIDRVAVFAKLSSMRDFHLLSRVRRNEMGIYQVNSQITGLDGSGMPYCFVLNKDHTISHIFIPHKEFPQMIEWYLDLAGKYLAKHS